MREDRKRHERRGGEGSGEPATEESMILWMDAYDDGYDAGYSAGIEQARKEFMETQLLIYHTGGNA
jgi:hypothetical protein